jgi:hypothetical protein
MTISLWACSCWRYTPTTNDSLSHRLTSTYSEYRLEQLNGKCQAQRISIINNGTQEVNNKITERKFSGLYVFILWANFQEINCHFNWGITAFWSWACETQSPEWFTEMDGGLHNGSKQVNNKVYWRLWCSGMWHQWTGRSLLLFWWNILPASSGWKITPTNKKTASSLSLLLAWFTLQPWRWRQYIPLIYRWTSIRLHGIISQKTVLFAMRLSNVVKGEEFYILGY